MGGSLDAVVVFLERQRLQSGPERLLSTKPMRSARVDVEQFGRLDALDLALLRRYRDRSLRTRRRFYGAPDEGTQPLFAAEPAARLTASPALGGLESAEACIKSLSRTGGSSRAARI